MATQDLTENTFNKTSTHPLQSWEWGEFRKKSGNEVVRFSFGQITVHKLGPLPFKIGAFIKGSIPTKEMLNELISLAKKENIIFIKLEPNCELDNNKSTIEILRKSGAIPGKTLFTPSTFQIDLSPSEENLMSGFSSKTRYNIRLALKNGVEVVEDNSDKAFEKYLDLTRETINRQKFHAHTEKYHRLMWQTLHTDLVKLGEKPIAHLLTARYQDEIITTWIIFVWKDFLYYPYGASTEKYKNVMANNLMMWEAIKFGKKLGLKTFDLWGREEGKGFTKFKEGYNPKVIEFLGTWDLVINPVIYWVYRLAEVLRWILLRLKSNFIKPSF